MEDVIFAVHIDDNGQYFPAIYEISAQHIEDLFEPRAPVGGSQNGNIGNVKWVGIMDYHSAVNHYSTFDINTVADMALWIDGRTPVGTINIY